MYKRASFVEYARRARAFIARVAELPPSCAVDTDAEFNRLALDLFALQFEAKGVCQSWWETRQAVPGRVDHWTRIPPVPTLAFKEFAVTCLPPEERTAWFESSGTTEGRPGRHYHNADSLELYEASLLPWFARHVIPDGRRLSLVALTPTPEVVPHSSLVHMLGVVVRKWGDEHSAFVGRLESAAGEVIAPRIGNTVGDEDIAATGVGDSTDLAPRAKRPMPSPHGAWAINLDNAVARLRAAVRDRRRVGLLGTAFSFVHLLDHLRASDERLALPPGSRAMETGGYKGRSRVVPREDLLRDIGVGLGIPPAAVVGEYGMCELSSQAYDHTAGDQTRDALDRRRFRFPPWARVRIVSPENLSDVAEGGTGLVCVYDLANLHAPLAIETQDLGERRGDGFALLGRATQAEIRGCSRQTVL